MIKESGYYAHTYTCDLSKKDDIKRLVYCANHSGCGASIVITVWTKLFLSKKLAPSWIINTKIVCFKIIIIIDFIKIKFDQKVIILPQIRSYKLIESLQIHHRQYI